MFRHCFPACCLLAFLAAAVPAAPAAEPADLAHGVWVITDTVLEHHFEPPARQQMLLDGLKGLLAKVGTPVPTDLSQRVSRVTTEEEFAALLRDLCPNPKAPADTSLEEVLIHSALAQVPGKPQYVPAEMFKVQQAASANRYVGTGIQIRKDPKEDFIQIILPFPGGPARKAGAKPGDLIVEVDGESMRGLTVGEVVKKLRGEEGTPVTVVVRQPGATETRTLKMVRTVVPFTSVAGFRRTGEESWDYRVDAEIPIAYLRIFSTSISTFHELRKLERQLLADGTRAVVIDLRGNPGGELAHAALVADGLLDSGPLWRTRDKEGRVKEYKADRDCLFRDCRVAVLVDEHTGSAAALIAAALQDNGRAVLVGEKSHYYGPVNSRITLPGDLGGLQLLTGLVERAKPKPPAKADEGEEEPTPRLQGFRVEPDHVVKMDAKQKEAMWRWKQQQDLPEPPPDAEKNPPEDPQLAKALVLLREGMK